MIIHGAAVRLYDAVVHKWAVFSAEEHEVVSADRLMVWIDVSLAAKSNFQKGLYNEIEH